MIKLGIFLGESGEIAVPVTVTFGSINQLSCDRAESGQILFPTGCGNRFPPDQFRLKAVMIHFLIVSPISSLSAGVLALHNN